MPGRSGNPNGRPRTSGLLNVLRETVQSVTEEGRTVEERLVEALIEEALAGKHRLAAIVAVFDRLEGKPKQSVEMSNNLQDKVAAMSDAELMQALRKAVEEDRLRSSGLAV
jgi:hypothetical protein